MNRHATEDDVISSSSEVVVWKFWEGAMLKGRLRKISPGSECQATAVTKEKAGQQPILAQVKYRTDSFTLYFWHC